MGGLVLGKFNDVAKVVLEAVVKGCADSGDRGANFRVADTLRKDLDAFGLEHVVQIAHSSC